MFNVLGKDFTMFFSVGVNSLKVFRVLEEMIQVCEFCKIYVNLG